MYKTILVPLDGSQTAGRGLAEAIALARALRSRIVLLHVISNTPWQLADGMPLTDDVVELLQTQGKSLLAQAAQAVQAAGVEVEQQLTEVLGDEVGETIVNQARSLGADLIVCGTHGRRGLERALIGSDAEHVARSATVPVLLVREPGGHAQDREEARTLEGEGVLQGGPAVEVSA